LTDEVLKRARRKAEAISTSVNQLIRDYLEQPSECEARRTSRRIPKALSSFYGTFERLEVQSRRTSRTAMSGLVFFDTNILVYSDDTASPEKQSRAIDLIADHQRRGTAIVSLQVLQEYYAAVTRKSATDAEVAQRKVRLFARGRIVRIDQDDVIAAIELYRLTRTSFWDALIVQAARRAGAGVLYSEDLQHGSVLGGVPIVNPFQ
jgi:predicted nucleic acid-binding protein